MFHSIIWWAVRSERCPLQFVLYFWKRLVHRAPNWLVEWDHSLRNTLLQVIFVLYWTIIVHCTVHCNVHYTNCPTVKGTRYSVEYSFLVQFTEQGRAVLLKEYFFIYIFFFFKLDVCVQYIVKYSITYRALQSEESSKLYIIQCIVSQGYSYGTCTKLIKSLYQLSF